MTDIIYQEEQSHLENVNICFKEKIDELELKRNKLLEKTKESKGSIEDVDVININMNNKYLVKLKENEDRPYFARMDFKFQGENDIEKIYIGKVGVEFKNDKYNIIDWRTPLGNIYYKGSLGECNHVYTDNKGMIKTISGTKLLKRNIEIENKKLIKVQDLETIAESKEKELELADKYLVEVLKQGSSNRLKDIIATIQQKQNDIIREELNSTVIIQGCAGSGKSTIALHRIAYLLYYYQDKLTEEDILVIAPNKLFIEYISTLLPDLGAINIQQDTFLTFAKYILQTNFDIENEYSNCIQDSNEIINKGSLKYKQIIDRYVSYLIDKVIPKEDIEIYGEVIFTKSELRKIFYDDFSMYSVNNRIERFKQYIRKLSDSRLDKIIEEKDRAYTRMISDFKKEASEYANLQKEISVLVDEKELVIKRIRRQFKIVLDQYLSKIEKIDAIASYRKFISNKNIIGIHSIGIIDRRDIDDIVYEGEQKLKSSDIAPILYLYSNINDIEKLKYKHIIIDESQDLSPFEIYVLRSFVINDSFTIVGDINQRIIPSKIQYEEDIVKDIFRNVKVKEHILNRSYRSSYEIMLFANEILKFNSINKNYLPEPVKRHGEKPIIVSRNNDSELVDEIVDKVSKGSKQYDNIAIIFKNQKQCKKYYELIKTKLYVNLVSEESEYTGGISIFPAYLTKGFEFDMVIIADCDKENYKNNKLDTNLLYVQCTRAMHNLIIMYSGTMSPLLLKIGKGFYQENETDQEKSIKIKVAKDSLLTVLNMKFGNIDENIDRIITEELDYDKIQSYIMKAAMESTLDKIFDISISEIKKNKLRSDDSFESINSSNNVSSGKDISYDKLIDELLDD